MNSTARLVVLPAFAASALLLSACFKPAEQAPPAKPEPAPEPFATAPAAPTTPPSVAGIPAAAIAAAERAKARVEVASTATADQGVIYKQAQTLFAERKFADVLRTLDTLQAELLTPAQEKAVAELRAKAQAALNPGAAASSSTAAPSPANTVVNAAANADNGTLFRQAKALFAEKKYTEALKALDAMKPATMNEAQQKAVADLRSQITMAGMTQ